MNNIENTYSQYCELLRQATDQVRRFSTFVHFWEFLLFILATFFSHFQIYKFKYKGMLLPNFKEQEGYKHNAPIYIIYSSQKCAWVPLIPYIDIHTNESKCSGEINSIHDRSNSDSDIDQHTEANGFEQMWVLIDQNKQFIGKICKRWVKVNIIYWQCLNI